MWASEMIALLKQRYPAPAWAFMTELPNGTGGNARNRADAVAFDLWPSRGLRIVGFEVKRSRRDWLAERSRPWKADAVGGYCDEWWLVVLPGVLRDQDMVPPLWGIMEVREGKLVIVEKAKPLRPRDLDRAFVASLLRRACELTPDAQLERAREAGKVEGLRLADEQQAAETKRLQDAHRVALDRLKGLTDVLGANDPEYVGRVLRFVRDIDPGQLTEITTKADNIGASAVRLANSANELRQLLVKLRDPSPPNAETTRPVGWGHQ